MRIKRICVVLLGLVISFSASSAMAEGWSMPKMFSGTQKNTKSSSTSQTLKKLGTGTKKFVSGTVDAITLKPLWDSSKKKKPWRPFDPWMKSSRKSTEKKPFWNSWLKPKE